MEPSFRATFRMPDDVRGFLVHEAKRNRTTQNAEFIRAVRERMERMQPATGESLQANAPAAGPNDTALQGGAITHR